MVVTRLLWIFRLPELRSAYVLRGAAVWLGLRVAVAFVPGPGPAAPGKLVILGLVALVTWLEAGRRREIELLGNLGIPPVAPIVAAVVLPALLELVV